MRLLDTNIFLRHLTNDDPVKAQACRQLFRDIESGKIEAQTTDLAIAEIVFVLTLPRDRNGYGYTRNQVRAGLIPLLSLKGLHLPTKGLYPRIFELYTTLPIDFIDAYHATIAEVSDQEIYSYDSDFDKISKVKRLEP